MDRAPAVSLDACYISGTRSPALFIPTSLLAGRCGRAPEDQFAWPHTSTTKNDKAGPTEGVWSCYHLGTPQSGRHLSTHSFGGPLAIPLSSQQT